MSKQVICQFYLKKEGRKEKIGDMQHKNNFKFYFEGKETHEVSDSWRGVGRELYRQIVFLNRKTNYVFGCYWQQFHGKTEKKSSNCCSHPLELQRGDGRCTSFGTVWARSIDTWPTFVGVTIKWVQMSAGWRLLLSPSSGITIIFTGHENPDSTSALLINITRIILRNQMNYTSHPLFFSRLWVYPHFSEPNAHLWWYFPWYRETLPCFVFVDRCVTISRRFGWPE